MLELKHICKTFNPGTVNAKAALNGPEPARWTTGISSRSSAATAPASPPCSTPSRAPVPVDSGAIVIDGRGRDPPAGAQAGQLHRPGVPGPHDGHGCRPCRSRRIWRWPPAGARRRGLQLGHHPARSGSSTGSCCRILDLGLEDRLTAKVGLLSGGQRQALTLLMATLQRPKLLLLDEHTAALDPKTAAKVLELYGADRGRRTA